MSNERQETITDIAAQMRGLADGMEKRGLYDLRECGTDYLRALADLIEASENHSVTNRNRLGNAAKMREALEKADEKRISDAVIQSLRDKKLEMAGEIAAKEAEIAHGSI